MTGRKRRPSPARTPVKVTDRRMNLRTGKLETWAAESADGKWRYVRTEDAKTTWQLTCVGHESFALAGSLNGAREMTESGAALRIIERQESETAATLERIARSVAP